MKPKIVIVGMGGHAQSVIDSVEQLNKYEIAGYVINEDKKIGYRGYPVLGKDDDLENIYQSGIKKAVVAIGYMGNNAVTRKKVYDRLKQIGFELPPIIDRTAIVASDVRVEEGVWVGKGAILNSAVNIGILGIVNTGAVIEHSCHIGEGTHISVGAVVCGDVNVGRNVFVGARATIKNGIAIGDFAVIGAGAVVVKDVKDGIEVVGVPAREKGRS